MPNDHQRRVDGAVAALAGLAAGIIKIVSAYPLDTVKTRVQLNPFFRERGTLYALRRTITREGFLSLYKGILPPVLGWSAIDSLLLGSLHNYRLFLLHSNGMATETIGTGPPRLTLLAHGVAGLFAGLTSAPLATPIELLKVRLQLQLQRSVSDRQFKGPTDCIRQIVRSQGLFGLWTGLSGGLLYRANFFYMFLAFEACMRGLSRLGGTPFELNVGVSNLISGGVASLCFWTIAIPFDRIKNQMLADQGPYTKRPSFVTLGRRIHASEGLRGFYRGLAPCLIRAVPSNACAFFVYEGILRCLGAEQTR